MNQNINSQIPGLPTWTWGALEAVLDSMADGLPSYPFVTDLVSITRTRSPYIPPEEVRRQVAMTFLAVLDPTFDWGALIMS